MERSNGRKRERYADVGRAIRQARDRAIERGASLKAHRALLGIIADVASWSRLVDSVAVYRSDLSRGDSLAERQNLDNSDARKALKWLAEEGIIIYRPGRNGKKSLLGLPAAGETGWHNNPPVNPGQIAPGDAGQIAPRGTGSSQGNSPRVTQGESNRGVFAPPSEDGISEEFTPRRDPTLKETW